MNDLLSPVINPKNARPHLSAEGMVKGVTYDSEGYKEMICELCQCKGAPKRRVFNKVVCERHVICRD